MSVSSVLASSFLRRISLSALSLVFYTVMNFSAPSSTFLCHPDGSLVRSIKPFSAIPNSLQLSCTCFWCFFYQTTRFLFSQFLSRRWAMLFPGTTPSPSHRHLFLGSNKGIAFVLPFCPFNVQSLTIGRPYRSHAPNFVHQHPAATT